MSTANERGVLAGWAPGVALTSTGHEQAATVGARLAQVPVARLVSSPVQRCLETATALGLADVVLEDRLGECAYGAWTGRTLTELADEPLWRVVQDDPGNASFPESDDYAAESLSAMAERVWAALLDHDAQVTASHGDRAVWVAVSHGDPIKSALATAAGAGIAGLQRFRVGPGSVSVIALDHGRASICAVNTTSGSLQAVLGPTAAEEVGGGAGGQ